MLEAEYLAFERASPQKHEYVDGEVFAMSGGTGEHAAIAAGLIRELGNAVFGRGCWVHTSDMRVKIPETPSYVYPDASVVCTRPEYLDDTRDTLTNPQVVVEVLSESTEAYDRGEKFASYQIRSEDRVAYVRWARVADQGATRGRGGAGRNGRSMGVNGRSQRRWRVVLAVALGTGCERAASEAKPGPQEALRSPSRSAGGSPAQPSGDRIMTPKPIKAPEASVDTPRSGALGVAGAAKDVPATGDPSTLEPGPDQAVVDLDFDHLPPPPAGDHYVPPTEPELRAAAHEDNRETCERNWPAMRQPSAELSRTCARFWVVHHGYGGRTDDFSLDPRPGGEAFTRLGARTLLAMAARVRAYCQMECVEADERAIELFETSASYHYRFDEVSPDAPWLVPIFQALLAGRPLETTLEEVDAPPEQTIDELLAELSPLTLVRLRNAPYARHGRAFKSRDLQSFFYDDPPPLMQSHFSVALPDRTRSGVFPLTVDPDYADAKLTAVDHANIAVIRSIEKRWAESE